MSAYSTPDLALEELTACLAPRIKVMLASRDHRKSMDDMSEWINYMSEGDEIIVATERKFAQAMFREALSICSFSRHATDAARAWQSDLSLTTEMTGEEVVGSETGGEEEANYKASRQRIKAAFSHLRYVTFHSVATHKAAVLSELVEQSLSYRSTVRDSGSDAQPSLDESAIVALIQSTHSLRLTTPSTKAGRETESGSEGADEEEEEESGDQPLLKDLLDKLYKQVCQDTFDKINVNMLDERRVPEEVESGRRMMQRPRMRAKPRMRTKQRKTRERKRKRRRKGKTKRVRTPRIRG